MATPDTKEYILLVRILFCGDTFPLAPTMIAARLPADEIAVCAPADVPGAARTADVVVPLMSRIDAATIAAARMRLIQQFGAGIEGVDLEAARARGMWVANTPSADTGNADSVAEHAVMLMLTVLRRLPVCQESLRNRRLGAPLGFALGGRTVCIVGLGAIGRALARRLGGFGVRLIGVTRLLDQATIGALGLDAAFAFEDRLRAFAETDVLALALPVTAATRGMIDEEAVARLRDHACIVNVARGPLIDYGALRAALESGKLLGAGLDVFWDEPIDPADPLLALSNVVATPHVAGVTDRSYAGIVDAVVTNIERARRGEPPLHRIA
jgi:phosphoglycerate dehydrogenase-like enzyme